MHGVTAKTRRQRRVLVMYALSNPGTEKATPFTHRSLYSVAETKLQPNLCKQFVIQRPNPPARGPGPGHNPQPPNSP